LGDFCDDDDDDDDDKLSDSMKAGTGLIIRIHNSLLNKEHIPWRWLLRKLA
jgi:hypothetical protein